MDFHRADEAIQVGYQETMQVMKKNQDVLAGKLPITDKIQQALERFFSSR